MISADRCYRVFEARVASEEMRVSGYAAVFDTPEVMLERDGVQYREEIARGAFADTEMRDVVLNYNHTGKPVARTRNGTLTLTVDERGLYVDADLSGTEEGRRLYEEIKGGYIDKMSFSFVVASDEYDRTTRTRRITGIRRIYDVAAVDIPAYESTSIVARSYYQAEAERERVEAEARRRQRLRILLAIEEAIG